MKFDTSLLVKKFIGIEIGGKNIKGMIIRGDGAVLCRDSVPTEHEKGGDVISRNIIELINKMIRRTGGYKTDIKGVGIGCPGLIDGKSGTVVFAGNLKLSYYPLVKTISEKIGMPVKLTNDASAAALGEAKFGAGKKYSDSVLVMIGTGLGGGIVIGGKLFEGGLAAGAEIGHTVIVENGEQCTCGRRGCFERYASASALAEQTRKAMREHPESAMWQTYDAETAGVAAAFEYMDSDETARAVIDGYITHLASGVINIVNIFRPQAVLIGGRISEYGEKITALLQKRVDKEIFAGTTYAPVKVITASLGKEAGLFGSAALFIN